MKINILGTEYTLTEADEVAEPNLTGVDGYCDPSVKEIVVDVMDETGVGVKKNLQQYKDQVVRHEIIHAFLNESGLAECSWGANEEMVDWIAIQFPKIAKAMGEVGVL